MRFVMLFVSVVTSAATIVIVGLFHATVDRLFEGPAATRAKNAAASIAHTFAMRMGLIQPAAGQLL